MLRARIDILIDEKRVKAGASFDTDEATSLTLLKMGWAEELPEEKPAKKPTKKKA